jgi:hypothetical protein
MGVPSAHFRPLQLPNEYEGVATPTVLVVKAKVRRKESEPLLALQLVLVAYALPMSGSRP